MPILNLGSGNVRLRESDVTLDANPLHRPDICAFVPPIPLKDASLDGLWSSHFIEHLPDDAIPALMAEVWRVLKLGAQAEFITPYAFSHGAIQDPTHRSQWVPEKFLYFSPHFASLGYGYEARFQVRSARHNRDEVRVVLERRETLEPCQCPWELN